MKMKRLANAALGLGLGIVTLPLAVGLWPAICAWFFYNETDVGAEEKEASTSGEGGPENG